MARFEAGGTVPTLPVLERLARPILAGIRSPCQGRKPATWTRIDQNYEALRVNMQTLFHDLGITTDVSAA